MRKKGHGWRNSIREKQNEKYDGQTAGYSQISEKEAVAWLEETISPFLISEEEWLKMHISKKIVAESEEGLRMVHTNEKSIFYVSISIIFHSSCFPDFRKS